MSTKPTPRDMGYYAALAQTGLEMVLPGIVGVFLDQWLGTTPWITFVLIILGFAAGLAHLMAILERKKQDEFKNKKPPP